MDVWGKKQLFRNTFGGVIGNILEWYDFAVFGYFAPVIGEQFFPSTSRTASLLSAFAVFAGAFVMRPVGGMLFGTLGDRLGRKPALQLSVVLMAISTTAMAILPTFERIGWFAPVLLVLCRLVQGLSVGGELIGSMSFVTELVPSRIRGFAGSLVVCSATAGVMLGSGVAALVEGALDPPAVASWGWRLPFGAGLLLGLYCRWMRDGIDETPHFQEVKREGGLSASPVREVARTMIGRVCLVADLIIISGAGFYVLFVWWPTFLTEFVRPPVPGALVLNTISMLVLGVLTPLAGWLSDLYGRRSVLTWSIGGLAVTAAPLFSLASSGSATHALLAQLVFAVWMAGVSAPMPATIMELFPTRTRYSGVALGYNTALALFGGTAPLMATLLISGTGILEAPAYYLILLSAVSLMACRGIDPRSHREPDAVSPPSRFDGRTEPVR